MTTPGDESLRVRQLIADEPIAQEDSPGQVGMLQRLCRAAARALPATGVGVSVVSGTGVQVRAAASDGTSEVIEELQFTFGEGPCVDSYASRRPVLTADLSAMGMGKWPGYVPAAHAQGVRAVFAFPMHVGTKRLGVLDVYRNEVGALSAAEIGGALSFAEAATQTLLQPAADGGDGQDAAWDTADGLVAGLSSDAAERRFEVYQAQGMVMIQLGVSLEEALLRLRAYAYANDRRLAAVAHDVVERRLTLQSDTDESDTDGPREQ